MKTVLMIAFHYPPYGGSTGVHRTLKFSKYLVDFGWKPIVLTATDNAYEQLDHRTEIPSHVLLSKAFAVDAVRSLSIKGRYPDCFAAPDRWMSWWPAAVIRGAAIIRKYKPDAIWSTYPLATAHAIALTLQRWSGLPWIADFRDPMSFPGRPGSGLAQASLVQRTRNWIETQTLRHCTKAVFTTRGAMDLYSRRFGFAADRCAVIPNGYDEEDFQGIPKPQAATRPVRFPLVLVHSGGLYRGDATGRDPIAFFEALAELRRAEKITPATVKIIFRGTSDDEYYKNVVRSHHLEDVVFVESSIAHRLAVAEAAEADGVLVFQGPKFNRQIPAKVYEYLRTGRPIFAVTDPSGDTASFLRSEGVGMIVAEAGSESMSGGVTNARTAIAQSFIEFLNSLKRADFHPVFAVERHSRKARTQELAAVLTSVCSDEKARDCPVEDHLFENL